MTRASANQDDLHASHRPPPFSTGLALELGLPGTFIFLFLSEIRNESGYPIVPLLPEEKE